jgi:hypothetical protein
MQPKSLAAFLEEKELELLSHLILAYVKEAPRHHHHAIRSIAPPVFILLFHNILSLLRTNEVANSLAPDVVYDEEGPKRKQVADVLEILVIGETVLRREILAERSTVSFAHAAAEFEQLNAAFHRLLETHVQEFCDECADSLIDCCRRIQKDVLSRRAKPLHDPLEHRTLAFLPPLHPHTQIQDTLKAFLQKHRIEIISRWKSLLRDDERQVFITRVESIDAALSEFLDEAISAVLCSTLHAPHLKQTRSPFDAAPNALHVIISGEEAIAGVLRTIHPHIDEFWLNLRAELNEAFHQLIRNNVASECTRCRTLLTASRNRLRALEHRTSE